MTWCDDDVSDDGEGQGTWCNHVVIKDRCVNPVHHHHQQHDDDGDDEDDDDVSDDGDDDDD